MKSVIEVKNVTKVFGKNETANQVLSDCCMAVKQGEFVSLMGASGSGKSTLLYLIGGLDRDYDGSILVSGNDISKKAMKERKLTDIRLRKMGFIFQFYNLVMNINVEDNILLPLTAQGESRSSIEKDLDAILNTTGLQEKRRSMPSTLSGGQQQRVAIARAMIGNPDIILADEPTGNLDSNSTQEIMDLFRKVNEKKGITILQVTHSDSCAAYGTRIVRLENGKAVG
ncbi:MAG: ABC transporter ATP-binding protein [Clostridiales bacterium]|nr:ABC transporter ATP-binding protein [Clostridiales bacterium]